jgi:hypothetical protein
MPQVVWLIGQREVLPYNLSALHLHSPMDAPGRAALLEQLHPFVTLELPGRKADIRHYLQSRDAL